MSLQISDAAVWQETAEGISAYHTETGEFRALNETAARIWMLVISNGERESVITKLLSEYSGGNPFLEVRIRYEVNGFISSMVESGLIQDTA